MMIGREETGASKEVRDLAEGFSKQSKLTNKTWLILFAVAVLIVVPDASLDGAGKKVLPFGLGSVDRIIFDSVSFFVLSIITIAFCSARAQALIAYHLAHARISAIEEQETSTDAKDKSKENIVRQRQYFDMLSTATLVRTGPLAVLAKATHPKKVFIQKSAGLYFKIIKFLALMVFLGMPMCALFYAWLELLNNSHVHISVKIIGTVVGFLTLIPLAQNWYVDAKHTNLVARKLSETLSATDPTFNEPTVHAS